MELNILTDGEIGNSVGVLAGKVGDSAQLAGSHHAVGNADAHHESLEGAAYSTLAPGNACTVTLGINAPPTKIGPDPIRRDRLESFASKAADLLQTLPWIHLPLQALGLLCFRFFGWIRHKVMVRN